MKKIIFILLALCIAWFTYHHFPRKSNFVKNFDFETSDSSNTLITIQNTGNKSVEFNFSLNNKFYASLNDFIRKYKNSNNSEQEALNLFNAFINSIVHEKLFNDWGAIPLTTLNSKGFAICGKQSEIFSQILYNAGYPSKIIHLEGHAVSEVFYNGSWHLFDTDRKTYFKNENNILSYKELVHSPQMFKKTGTKKHIANLTTIFENYTKLFITEEDNKFKEINHANNDTFLLNIPAKASFIFPFYPDYKRDFYPYNTKAKLFIPKGFNGNIKNPLILINVEGKGKVKFNKHEYLVPDEVELLKAAIFNSKQFINTVHVSVLSDSFALVYMINPVFSKIYTKNNFFINASDSLRVDIIKNKKASKTILYPTHIELLNQYTLKAFDLVKKISLFNIKNTDELYEKQISPYCVENNLDTMKIKKRFLTLKNLLNKPIENYADESTFYEIVAVFLYGKDDEFRNLLLFNYKYYKYKELLKKIRSDFTHQKKLHIPF